MNPGNAYKNDPSFDTDRDGYLDAAQCGTLDSGLTDCDDTDDDVYPGAQEVLDDGIDNNCDSAVNLEGIDWDVTDPLQVPGLNCACSQSPCPASRAPLLPGLLLFALGISTVLRFRRKARHRQ